MPNSILWIGLVVLWVFVLFPMLADRHPRIRRTTDAALATRVLHRGGTKRRMRKGPGAGHETDPDWVPARVQRKLSHGDDAEDRMTTSADEPVIDDETTDGAADLDRTPRAESPAAEDADIIDAEVDAEVDPSGADEDADDEVAARAEDPVEEVAEADPADEIAERPLTARAPAPRAEPEDEYEYEPDSEASDFIPSRRGRGGYDPEADAIARAARYRFRQRSALGLVLSMLLCGGFAVAVSPLLWWVCGLAGVVLATYLVYLRRQVRMEEEIRRRRAARLSRHRPEIAPDDIEDHDSRPTRPTLDRDAARALRRRAVVLDVDDEDPMFDHLEPFDAAAARATRNRAAGGEIRRAAGE
ncbi:hypothetical protein NDR87_25100 [Nocardia sp. CDC159]|uniref:Transmembrane protein n=1 Tax=Nocardia pulmonis TaxID=2951408 RepID=A0A9X2E6F4_9NOCA|nr:MULTISPECIES: gephyrin-like molybdotransferase receptor GlpR [Nocardia]MCM6775182.1 hypothetical protein [Nocardia pulmonis]MCM6789652.1 hypothetical protein [Nocardia sp. CDC159]